MRRSSELLNRLCVLVQRENEQAALPKRRDTALWAGIFKAKGSTDPMFVFHGRRNGHTALIQSSFR
jgi:hypothetical protein